MVADGERTGARPKRNRAGESARGAPSEPDPSSKSSRAELHDSSAAFGQVALLRGINVGKAKRVAMADLRALLSNLGFQDVRTLLNSGNAVFLATDRDPRASAGRIETAMAEELGVSARALVLSESEFATVVHENTLEDIAENASRLHVAFLADPAAGSRLAPLMKREWGEEVLAVGTRAAYLWCPAGLMASELVEAVGQSLGDAVTLRTWNTVKKIDAAIKALKPS